MRSILLFSGLFLIVTTVQAQDTIRRVQLPGNVNKKISGNRTIKKVEPSIEQTIVKKINYVLDTFALQNNGDPFFIPKIKSVIETVLYPYLREGWLYGNEPRNAWQIQCGSQTMTIKDKEDGRLVVFVSLALKKPSEFDVFRFERIVLNKQSLRYY